MDGSPAPGDALRRGSAIANEGIRGNAVVQRGALPTRPIASNCSELFGALRVPTRAV